jgi:dolichol-phosphate mannosyltransferase
MTEPPKEISLVVPVLDEALSIAPLMDQIAQVAKAQDWDYQVVFVDDGSRDATWQRIAEQAAANRRVHGLRLRRNFGKATALAAGFQVANSPIVVTIDGDLQDDPAEIPKLLAAIAQGKDVVSGWKQDRKDPWHKVIPSRWFNAAVGMLTGVRLHDHNCGLKAYRREVLREIELYGELHRFVPVLAASRGFVVGEVPVRHHPRKHGKSKYGWSRLAKGLLDLLTVYFLTGFRQRPLHLLGGFGLGALLLGGFVLTLLSCLWVITRTLPGWTPLHLHQRALFYFAILSILLGVQWLSIGILAELIVAQRPDTKPLAIAERVGSELALSHAEDASTGAQESS